MANKFSNAFVDALPFADVGQNFFRDAEVRGLGLRVGTASKVYIAEGKVNKKSVRITIGRHGVFDVEQARSAARTILGMLAQGINPNHVTSRQVDNISLEAAYQSYLIARPDLKPRTVYDYNRFMKSHFAEWANKALIDIHPELVLRKHRAIGQRSQAQANLAMRFLRALFNFAIAHYRDKAGNPIFTDNPAKLLSTNHAWYRMGAQQRVIKAEQLPAWLKAVHILPTITHAANKEAVKDYLLLLIFTGMHSDEGLRLEWNAIDFKTRTLTVQDLDHQHSRTLPLSMFLYYLLKKRQEQMTGNSPYVFPADSTYGYMDNPAKLIKLVVKTSGVDFTAHDLRRTFIAIAESMDISTYALKQLVHFNVQDEGTAGYMHAEATKDAMQKISDYLMGLTMKLN